MSKSVLSGNSLKIVAAISMLIDHIGLILFPGAIILRIIGRLAFPIFAFMIAEGCIHTKNKLRYALTVFISGAIFQSVYYIFSGDMYMNIFITFSLSIILVYALQNYFASEKKLFSAIILFSAIAFVFILNIFIKIDYGFFGCIAPMFAILPCCHGKGYRLFSFAAGILLVCIALGGIQYYSMLSVLLLMCYSGKRGKLNMKYFFYIFYPLHLIILYAISSI